MAKQEDRFNPEKIKEITLTERELLYALVFQYVEAFQHVEAALDNGKRKLARDIVLRVKGISGPYHAILAAMNSQESLWPSEIRAEKD